MTQGFDGTKWPHYPWYPRDFLADVTELTETEELMYRRLLDYQWLQGEVPSDAGARARACRLAPMKASKAWKAIAKHFPVWDDGRLRNKRMEREREKVMALSGKRSLAGAAGASRRWQTDGNAIGSANGKGTGNTNGNGGDKPVAGRWHTKPEAENSSSTSTADAHDLAIAALTPGGEEALQYVEPLAARFRASHHPEALFAEIGALASGQNGPEGAAVPLAIIGKAIQQMAASEGVRFSPRSLRNWCEDLMRPKPEGRSDRTSRNGHRHQPATTAPALRRLGG